MGALTVVEPRSGIEEAKRRLARAMRLAGPPPRLTVSEWADRYRMIPKDTSPEPGKWDTSRAEYQRGMMDVLNDPDVEDVVYMTSSQVGKTEIVNNAVGYFIDQDPSPMLVVMPTVELAEAWSKDRLTPTLQETPRLRGRVSEARSRDSANTITHKRFAGGRLSIVGANAPSSLAMRPIRIVLGDEVDRFPASAGSEGDPVALAKRRTANFWNRKHVLTSTPTVKGLSRIEEAWEESDQRRYFVPCPICGHDQVLKWNPKDGRGGIVYQKTERGDAIPETARYKCEECEGLIEEHHKPEMLRRGRWVAGKPSRGIAGFHIWAAYSPWTTWAEIVALWDKSHKNPERLKVFVNTVLGETWEEDGESIDADALKSRLEEYDATVPTGVGVLVGAVDVQSDRLEVVVKGYGAGEESWLVEHVAIYGDPGGAKVWEDLLRLVTSRWKSAGGIDVGLDCVVVDSGGHHTEQVYAFCRPLFSRRVFPIKGAGGPREIVGKMTKTERYRTRLFVIGVDTAKDVVFSRLKVRVEGPGFLHLPITAEDEYLEQLTSERPVRVWKKGRGWVREWKKTRDRNEAWDLEVYALAALHILGPSVIRDLPVRAAKLAGDGAPPPVEDAGPAPVTGTRIRPKRRGWVTGWR